MAERATSIFAKEVGGCPSMDKVGSTFSIERILRFNPSKAFDKKSAIDQYRCGHAFFLITKRPRVWRVLDD
jgi:hypothetical protein